MKEPTEQQIADGMRLVHYEMWRLLSVCNLTGKTEDEERVYLEAVLVHVRILIEFFAKKVPTDDSMHHTHYGVSVPPVELDGNYIRRLHKDLSHLSYDRLKRHEKWNLKNVIPPVIKRCIDFMRKVLDSPPEGAKPEELRKWEELLSVFEIVSPSTE